MSWHFHPLLLIPTLSCLLNASLAWFGWRKRPAEGAVSFALVMLAAAIWSGGNALELGSGHLAAKIFWLKIEYIGILLLPASWLVFALQLSGRSALLTRRVLFPLSIEPLFMLLMLWTNEAHGLFTRHFGLRPSGAFLVWENVSGPLYWANIVYSYALILTGAFLLLRRFSSMPASGQRELFILIGVLLPWLANLLYAFYDFPVPGLDPTPFALTLTGIAFAWGLFSLRLLDFIPPASPPPTDLPGWRLNVLEGILRGVFIVWLFALASGINNVLETYFAERAYTPNALSLALSVLALYVGLTLLVGVITFARRLPYALRAGLFLAALYLLGAVGLALASLSGDGRVFLFAFVLLAAVFFGFRVSLVAALLSLLTLISMGWLQVNGILLVPPTRQINSTDPGAWISGTLVFTILSAAALVSITSLLRALQRSLETAQRTLAREQRLGRVLHTVSDINQLIVRERNPQRLLQRACEALVEGRGYSFAWIGLLEPDGATLTLAASAGPEADPAQFTLHLDREESGPICAVQAIRSRAVYRVDPTAEVEACATCPFLAQHPQRASLALPLLREEHPFGVLIIDQADKTDLFDPQESALLEELADDLAYAIENLRAAEQQSALVEISTALLFARDEDMLWTEVIDAVQRLLRADRVAIYLYDRATDRLSCPRSYGLSPEYVAEINRRFHEVPGSAILSKPQPVVVQDVKTDARTAPLRESMLREGFRSYAVFPFYTSKGMSGAFTAYRNPPGPFTASDLTAGETLVRMIGLALENANLNLEARRKAADLGALYAAAQDMASSLLDSQALLYTLARHMTESLNATSAYISTVNISNGTFIVTAEYWSERASPAECKPDIGRQYALGDYPAFRETLLSGKTSILHADDPRCSEAERSQFDEYGVCSILFVPVLARGKALGGIEIWESRRKREFNAGEMFLAQSMAAHAGSALENAALYEQTRLHAEELAQAYDSTLAGWARALELRDEPTEGHTRRVTELTLRLARKLGIPESDLVHIRRGALLHDIGKMGIPDSILHKPGPLTKQEQRIMRMHPHYAYEMLSTIPFLKDALHIPYCHHELWDGSGYPRGLKGEEIPLAARIFTVADNWDALTSDRPYRPAWPKEKARQYIRENTGKLFDPNVVEAFLSLDLD
ncbi:MAG: GAF domain-containing protein [Chloroflexi bacterium]|nr:GAF domain-containing protein [Chloroflexota bacterium]